MQGTNSTSRATFHYYIGIWKQQGRNGNASMKLSALIFQSVACTESVHVQRKLLCSYSFIFHMIKVKLEGTELIYSLDHMFSQFFQKIPEKVSIIRTQSSTKLSYLFQALYIMQDFNQCKERGRSILIWIALIKEVISSSLQRLGPFLCYSFIRTLYVRSNLVIHNTLGKHLQRV